MSDAIDKALEALKQAAREEATASLNDIVFALCEAGHKTDARDVSHFVETLLARKVDKSVITWVALLMIADVAQRGWLRVGRTRWTQTENENEYEPDDEEFFDDVSVEWDYDGLGIEISDFPRLQARLFGES